MTADTHNCSPHRRRHIHHHPWTIVFTIFRGQVSYDLSPAEVAIKQIVFILNPLAGLFVLYNRAKENSTPPPFSSSLNMPKRNVPPELPVSICTIYIFTFLLFFHLFPLRDFYSCKRRWEERGGGIFNFYVRMFSPASWNNRTFTSGVPLSHHQEYARAAQVSLL